MKRIQYVWRISILLSVWTILLNVAIPAIPAQASSPNAEYAPHPIQHPRSSFPTQINPPYGGRVWDGHNPFHQPAATTDYYGSGDANNDGTLSSLDVTTAQGMAIGLRTPSARADVDGNGEINTTDVTLINDAVNGATLPAWWNQLPGRAEREAWVSKFMARDPTDQHTYDPSWFVCHDFATQTFLNGAFYRGDLSTTRYTGGQTVFNIPLYHVTILTPMFGHAFNAILVGDDPLNFDDWRFFEPQMDEDIHPGIGFMPYSSTVKIQALGLIDDGAFWSIETLVVFFVDEAGEHLQEYNPNLVLTRPTPEVKKPDNRPDLWNPRIIPTGAGHLLYERVRDDLSRVTDIHLTPLPFVDPPIGAGMIQAPQYSRLLDIFVVTDTVHILWQGKPEYVPGVFYGQFDIATATLSNTARVAPEHRRMLMGRVIAAPSGEIHVFWLESQTNVGNPYPTGIYWTRNTGSGWEPAQNLVPALEEQTLIPRVDWDIHDRTKYAFDTALSEDNNIHLVWINPVNYPNDDEVRHRIYNGAWNTSTVITATNGLGVALEATDGNKLHLAYWVGAQYNSTRGKLFHHTYEGAAWSAAQMIDADDNAGYPRMTAGTGDALYAVWNKRVNDQVIPIWREYEAGEWHTAQTLNISSGTDAWYPTVDRLPDGTLVFAWSSRAADRVTIETHTITPSPSFTLDKEAFPRYGLRNNDTLTYTLILSGTGSNLRLWDPLPGNIHYVTGSLTSSVTPAAIYSATHRAIFWEGDLLTDTLQTIQFQVTPGITDTSSLLLSPPIINTAWLTDTERDLSTTATVTINDNRIYLPCITKQY